MPWLHGVTERKDNRVQATGKKASGTPGRFREGKDARDKTDHVLVFMRPPNALGYDGSISGR